MGCMVTLRAGTLRGVWRSSRSKTVGLPLVQHGRCDMLMSGMMQDMLTPIEKPLDPLTDLTASEMYVPRLSSFARRVSS